MTKVNTVNTLLVNTVNTLFGQRLTRYKYILVVNPVNPGNPLKPSKVNSVYAFG